MRRYYLLQGYLIPTFYNGGTVNAWHSEESYEDKVQYFRLCGYPLPRNWTLVRLSPNYEICVVYHDFNRGQFLIKAKSRKDAYHLADIIRCYYTLAYGWTPLDMYGSFYLQELFRVPRPTWTKEDLIKALQESRSITGALEPQSIGWGYVLDEDSLSHLKSFVIKVAGDHDLCASMSHLLESKFLFDGFMTPSYYTCHYTPQRRRIPRWLMEKRYYENRHRYETAFVAAFKGIERYFRVNDFSKNEIPTLFRNIDYEDVRFDTVYTRYHEVFSGAPKKVSYGELLAHFLVLRNAVAAHGNRKPPARLIITEDNIYEIQLFLEELISKAAGVEA